MGRGSTAFGIMNGLRVILRVVFISFNLHLRRKAVVITQGLNSGSNFAF